MPTLQVTNFNIVVSVLGGWVSMFGLVSYLCKENLYLSEAMISLLAGVVFSPHGLNLIRPQEYTSSRAHLDEATLAFSRLVLGVQLVLCGVQLPARYIRMEWKPLMILVGGIMSCMWLMTSSIIWLLVPGIPFLHSLAVGACVTPTDPILSAVIVKGKFADRHVPKDLQDLIVSESGLNDGLGYPFLCFALYLIKCWGHAEEGGLAGAATLWFGEMWGYTILFSIVYGAAVGWAFRYLLWMAESRHWVDRESFLVFAIAVALFIVGTCGMLGSDDVLACFIAGNVFNWNDWFRSETKDDSLQPTIDMLLNVSIFMWFGAMCPWDKFVDNDIIPSWRLFILGILVLLFRRLPFLYAAQKCFHQIKNRRQAIFVGFFGPIGVSAIFYLYVADEYLRGMQVNGHIRPDVAALPQTIYIIVWFLCICSIVVHGLSIPVGTIGTQVPRAITRILSTKNIEGMGHGHGPPSRWPAAWRRFQQRRDDTYSDPGVTQHLLAGQKGRRDDSPDGSNSPEGPSLQYMGTGRDPGNAV